MAARPGKKKADWQKCRQKNKQPSGHEEGRPVTRYGSKMEAGVSHATRQADRHSQEKESSQSSRQTEKQAVNKIRTGTYAYRQRVSM